ncbi:MAG: hypothetical protein ACU0D1_01860 [Pseudooceanicola nanhaiensis]
MKFRIGLLALALGLAGAGRTQDVGGVQLTFSLSERLEAARNLALSPVSAGTTYRADTTLGMTFASITRHQSLTFSADVALRAADGPGVRETFDIADPSIALDYERRGANSRFELQASASTDDIAFLRPLSDFVNDDGIIELPDDIADLQGSGRRDAYSASTALVWGEDGPVEVGVNAGFSVIDYRNTSATLFDNHRYWTGANLVLSPRSGRSLATSLRYTRYETDDPSAGGRDQIALDTRFSADLPQGEIFAGIGLDHANSRTRYSVSAGWDRSQPGLDLSLGIGAARLENGEIDLTASAGVTRELPRGSISAQLERGVTNGIDNLERTETVASLSYGHEFSELTRLSLGGTYVRTTRSATNNSVSRAEFSASVSHTLTQDWNANLGYRKVFRKDEAAGTGWASSDVVFFGVSRSFGTRW